ncbi:MAG: beta-ketoacyl-[acyl-carrier-protein] synthase family protein [Candidatus Angelobacter sp.]
MRQHRVAITGMGMISALGPDLAGNWSSLAQGKAGIAPILQVDTSKMRFQNGAEVRDYIPEKHFPSAQLDLLDRFAQFALIAAREALAGAGLKITPELAGKMAVVTGSCVGGQNTQDAGFVNLYQKNSPRVHPLLIPRTMANAGASHISMELGIYGPVYTISTACSSSNHAIGNAFWMVRSGQVAAAITGGSEAPFSMGLLKAWEAMRVVSAETCRPFSKDRKGLILGEGAGMLVLEQMERALARGARIYGEIVGFGMSSDAGHITSPTTQGPAVAIGAALADAQLAPEQIGYINAHGTGTPTNDQVETRAIRDVFGNHAERLMVSSTKSMHGHALGAAGALEAVATVMAMREKLIPPTANFTTPDADCDLDIVPNQARPAEIAFALSNSFAFGGLNAVLAFAKA